MRFLRRRQHEQRPEPIDQAEAWAGLLHRYHTRSSPAMQLAAYKRKHRQRQQVEAAVAEILTPSHPLTEKSRDLEDGGTLQRPHPVTAEPAPLTFAALTPDAPGLAPHEAAPDFDESAAARLRRRYGDVGEWRWV
jgi:hypothetical protein